jgi:hypothetical protein
MHRTRLRHLTMVAHLLMRVGRLRLMRAVGRRLLTIAVRLQPQTREGRLPTTAVRRQRRMVRRHPVGITIIIGGIIIGMGRRQMRPLRNRQTAQLR